MASFATASSPQVKSTSFAEAAAASMANAPSSTPMSTQEANLLELMLCPITGEVMIDPVFAADGQTYERVAIEGWLQAHGTSPITGAVLPHKELVSNYSMRSTIDEMAMHDPRFKRRLRDLPLSLHKAEDRNPAPPQRVTSAEDANNTASKSFDEKVSSIGQPRGQKQNVSSTTIPRLWGVSSRRLSKGVMASRRFSENVRSSRSLARLSTKCSLARLSSAHLTRHAPPKLDDFAAVVVAARLASIKEQVRWRSEREQKLRWAIAWFGNSVVYFLAALIVLVYGVQALGPSAMTATVLSWVVALLQVFLIIEPAQVCLVTVLQFWISDDTVVGRCFRRIQWCYNEFFSP
ncbi:hypothetical protein AB1Y20_004250 [Prymnesium parvum]|uniref:U-box domain-containing protein n=1 Tax=Prymnesium parvum TaxID=97485 RepID=A0AB34J7B7_PRYPA